MVCRHGDRHRHECDESEDAMRAAIECRDNSFM